MKWFTHQSIAVMAAIAMGSSLAGVLSAWAGSIAPDVLDQRKAQKAFFRRRAFNKIHRGSSHWFGWWMLGWAFAKAGLLGPLSDELLSWFAAGALSHVVLDMCTTRGVPLIPWTGRRFSLRICSTGGIGEYAFLATAAALFWLAEKNALSGAFLPLL
ncbi:MAG: metal-dependent hydrolase [Mailhella sp.]|nr:metal-dependent hydrolase [Mailhella sp.]